MNNTEETLEWIERLAEMSLPEYEKIRKKEAKEMGFRESVLDKMVDEERKRLEHDELANSSIVNDVEEWAEDVEGEQILSELETIYKQYAILPDGAHTALALWTLGTYCFNAFRIFPMIGLSSPEKRCGKSTVMSLLGALTNKSLISSNITPAAIFRVAELCQPTLLIDEADTFLKDNDELRGIINSGHTKDTAFVIRTAGDNHDPRRFSTWTPKALAMIGDLPDTNRDRSIVIIMRRKLPNESVLKIPLTASEQFMDVRRQCKRWATDNFERLAQDLPEMPKHNNDREIDNWTPLISIAHACNQSVDALTAMNHISPKDEDDGIGPMILADVRKAFDEEGVDRILSKDLVEYLIELEDRPWSEWRRGKPLTQNSLAFQLKRYNIKPKSIRTGTHVFRGYEREDFDDAFLRYLLPDTPFQSATTLQSNDINGHISISNCYTKKDVALQESLKPASSNDCSTVAVEKGQIGGNGSIQRKKVDI